MKYKAIAFISFFLLLGFGSSTFALDISLEGSLGNMVFDTSRVTALSDGNQPFAELLYISGTAKLEQPIADSALFAVIFNRDPILRNSLYTTVSFDTGYAKIAVGPFFGLFNAASSLITSGLSTTLTMTLPGVLYGTFRSDTTIGAGITVPGDYVQQRSEMAFGVWGPNTLTSFRLSTKTFTLKQTASLTTVDSVTNYDMVTEVFKKNVPYTAIITLGYQSLKRSYISASTSIDELAALMIGMNATFRFSDAFKIMGGARSPLYAWGVGSLKSPASTAVLYEGIIGIVISADNIKLPTRRALSIGKDINAAPDEKSETASEAAQ
ncbi:hypothetical protein [Gracilinema caldarium]|uniref:hypothetical protein n=1 Tax=Gracilinema caldarium TaxID=215591 RepID=UPI0026F1B27D|nr:hypothetical protein [Gracilinema caldarium]